MIGRHRVREPEPLRQPASVGAQEDVFALGLDTLGERHHVERLRDLDIPEDAPEEVAEEIAARPGAKANPRPVTPADVARLLRAIW